MRYTFIGAAILSACLISGCSTEQQSTTYQESIDTAWLFIESKGWDQTAKGNGDHAEVTEVVVDEDYVLMDESFHGEEVLSIRFEDKENVVVSTPVVLVEPKANEVVGYVPGE
ncbi:hypothetical protein LCM20_09815 [Halobacillus litoralis]|uniref:hypothetical protein n=1 Tax=Halobacillus litoralis TaxID=45668 RepID=UPI001CD3183B|nr:hypothetical protein [Halobacillus litoralis]MCA0970886.1 hypothetical protein [Halobacillus litoralis]